MSVVRPVAEICFKKGIETILLTKNQQELTGAGHFLQVLRRSGSVRVVSYMLHVLCVADTMQLISHVLILLFDGIERFT